MVTRADIMREGESWYKTPFAWGKSQKGVGCDCKGLIAGVARALRLPGFDSEYAKMENYRKVDRGILHTGFAAVMDRVREPRPADVLIFRVRGIPAHCALLLEGRIIHAYARSSPRIVVFTDLGGALATFGKPVSAWTWRSIDGD